MNQSLRARFVDHGCGFLQFFDNPGLLATMDGGTKLLDRFTETFASYPVSQHAYTTCADALLGRLNLRHRPSLLLVKDSFFVAMCSSLLSDFLHGLSPRRWGPE